MFWIRHQTQRGLRPAGIRAAIRHRVIKASCSARSKVPVTRVDHHRTLNSRGRNNSILIRSSPAPGTSRRDVQAWVRIPTPTTEPWRPFIVPHDGPSPPISVGSGHRVGARPQVSRPIVKVMSVRPRAGGSNNHGRRQCRLLCVCGCFGVVFFFFFFFFFMQWAKIRARGRLLPILDPATVILL